MRFPILIGLVAIGTVACASDSTLADRLDAADLESAARVFSQVIETGDRDEWEQLHRYFVHNPERYRQILKRVDHLPWKGTTGHLIRNRDRVMQFNGSHYRFIHGLDQREFRAYVYAYLRTITPSVESMLSRIESRCVVVRGENGDDGHYFGSRRLGIAMITRTFPQLRTSYDWKSFNRYDADDRKELDRIASYIRSQVKTAGESNDNPRSR